MGINPIILSDTNELSLFLHVKLKSFVCVTWTVKFLTFCHISLKSIANNEDSIKRILLICHAFQLFCSLGRLIKRGYKSLVHMFFVTSYKHIHRNKGAPNVVCKSLKQVFERGEKNWTPFYVYFEGA